MQNGEEIQSNAGAGSEFFEDNGQQQQQNIGHHSIDDANDIGILKAQIGMLKAQIIEKNSALLESNLENVKLRGMMEKETHKKQIDLIKREFEEKLKKAMEQMKAELIEECQQKMDEKEEAANKRFEQLEKANQQKQQEEADESDEQVAQQIDQLSDLEAAKKQLEQLKRERMANEQKVAAYEQEIAANEQKIAANNQIIERLKQVSMTNQRKMAEQEEASKKWQLGNPKLNKWDETETQAIISADGLKATYTGKETSLTNVFAISFSFAVGQHKEDGIQIMYYEVKTDDSLLFVGLSPIKRNGGFVGLYDNSIAINPPRVDSYRFSGSEKKFERPSGVDKPTINKGGRSNVFGCGVLAWPDGKRAIFFTANGILLGKHIPFSGNMPLYPAVSFWNDHTIEANFGNNLDIPFEYDVKKCPGLNLDNNE